MYVNCGYWAGVMLSPQAGKWIAEMVTGKMEPQENPLRVSRFEEGVAVAGTSLLRGRH
jgi:sarcosine oxidase subunit beta